MSACLIEHFREMLLEYNNKVIDVYNAPFPEYKKMRYLTFVGKWRTLWVYWEPRGGTQIKDNVDCSP